MTQDTVFIVWIALLGLCVGSFLNVVIHRLPCMIRGELVGNGFYSLSSPPSHCPSCKHSITAWENVPLLSYLVLRGKCRNCKTSISWRYPFIETLTCALSGLAAWHLGANLTLGASLVFLWMVIALSAIDYDTMLLPDSITLPLLAIGVGYNAYGGFVPLRDAVLGAFLAGTSLWVLYKLHSKSTGRDGMGFGDFKLMAAMGAWFGWQALPALFVVSSLLGLMVAAWLSKRNGFNAKLPFGPCIGASGVVVLLAYVLDLDAWIGVL